MTLITYSKSFEHHSQKCHTDELQAGIEPALAVIAQMAVLVGPCKATLHYRALGHHFEGVQLTGLYALYCDMFT